MISSVLMWKVPIEISQKYLSIANESRKWRGKLFKLDACSNAFNKTLDCSIISIQFHLIMGMLRIYPVSLTAQISGVKLKGIRLNS